MELILSTSARQKEEIENIDAKLSVPRVSAKIPSSLKEFVRIITGIRRCGKSTFVNQDFSKSKKMPFILTLTIRHFMAFLQMIL